MTYRIHFNEDVHRAALLVEMAKAIEETWSAESDPTVTRVFHDIRLAGVALSVGAMDAYFCDAYIDCITSVLGACQAGTWKGDLPGPYATARLPAGEILSVTRKPQSRWNVRMAATKLIERESMLSLDRVKQEFNAILPESQQQWGALVPPLLLTGSKRLTGPVDFNQYASLSGKDQASATKEAISTFKKRIADIVQLRHDWIHNCGRPKRVITELTHGQAMARVGHIAAFTEAFDDHLQVHRLAGAS